MYLIHREGLFNDLEEHLTYWLRDYDQDKAKVEREAKARGESVMAFAARCIAADFIKELDQQQDELMVPAFTGEGGAELRAARVMNHQQRRQQRLRRRKRWC